jgi:hypothetical protein
MIERLLNKEATPSDEFLLFFLLFSFGFLLTYILWLITVSQIKLFKIKRKTKTENRYSKKMGRLIVNVTSIKLYFLEIIPVKTYHVYRDTYYGEIKDLKECNLNK